ncbi:MAG: hypothetical protein Fur0037_11530 [Planctomycetota bacterium]
MVALPRQGSSDRWLGVRGPKAAKIPRVFATRLRPFQKSDQRIVVAWLAGPGLGLPPGAAGTVWAERLLGDPRIRAFVAERGDSPVGFARLDIGPDRIADLTIAVAPGIRGSGVGGEILDAVLDTCRFEGIRRVTAIVDASNEPARRLFASRGFDEEAFAASPSSASIRFVRRMHGPAIGDALEIEV